MKEKTKNKISETLKRKFVSGELICPWKGKPRSKEHSKKLSEVNKGKRRGTAWKKKIAKINKGNKYALGMKHTKEWKKQASLRMKGNPQRFKIGHIPWNKCKKTGLKPWNYIDGRSKKLSPARYGDDWDKIRYLVYLRDKFTCQDCLIKGVRLDVHHKIPFLISFDNSLKNLITLCRPCHMKEEAKIIRELNMEVIIP